MCLWPWFPLKPSLRWRTRFGSPLCYCIENIQTSRILPLSKLLDVQREKGYVSLFDLEFMFTLFSIAWPIVLLIPAATVCCLRPPQVVVASSEKVTRTILNVREAR